MHPFTYQISLRIRHPTMDPQIFTETIGMQPKWASRAGEPRATSTSPWLEGNHAQSYWTSRLMLPDELEFEESLLKKIQDMQPNRTFFKLIRDTGGSAELFIGLFPDGANIGTTLPHDLLTAAGDLGLDLALDIYNPK